ncbi:PREDICTED: putative B3 domain-containing protein At4g12617 [Brassica oleracea var. oleracea]|uniref:TF-B3 domain-containing protein n=1 Tax=Brassica oleracea var. oleracea TaxID=109376 RepID=A0A0D3ALR7_BRAOL|nr:PREDICTED: putative B3 domain-containing protein At4g12617 [Brassica oleracea var. oleracea]
MARTVECRDKPFDPNNQLNILITLKESDTGSSVTITMPKELVEANLFPWWSKYRCAALSRHNAVQFVDLFDYDSKITTTHTLRRERDGNFKFCGWGSILAKRSFKTGDIIGFWWDKYHDRLNFELLMVA